MGNPVLAYTAKNTFCVRIRSRIRIGTEAYYRDGIRLECETYAIAQHLLAIVRIGSGTNMETVWNGPWYG